MRYFDYSNILKIIPPSFPLFNRNYDKKLLISFKIIMTFNLNKLKKI